MSRFGEFTLLESLGAGPHADRYRALHDTLGGPFFLKTYRRLPVAFTPQLTRRADRLIGVREAGLVQHLGHGDVGGVQFVVSPLLNGFSLSDFMELLKTERLNLEFECILYLASQVADALHTLHSLDDASLTHGALSADHVFISEEGEVSLCGLTTPRGLTPQHEPHRAFDLVGLGALIYDMLRGENFRDTRAQLPRTLVGLVTRAMDPHSALTPAAFLDELEALTAAAPPTKESLLKVLRALATQDDADELPVLEPVSAVPEPLDIPAPVIASAQSSPKIRVKDPLALSIKKRSVFEEEPVLTEDTPTPGSLKSLEQLPVKSIPDALPLHADDALATQEGEGVANNLVVPTDLGDAKNDTAPDGKPALISPLPKAMPPVAPPRPTRPKALPKPAAPPLAPRLSAPRSGTPPAKSAPIARPLSPRAERPQSAPLLDPFTDEATLDSTEKIAPVADIGAHSLDDVTRPDFAAPAREPDAAAVTQEPNAPLPKLPNNVRSLLADPLLSTPAIPVQTHQDPGVSALMRAKLVDQSDLASLGKYQGRDLLDILIAAKGLNEGRVAAALAKAASVLHMSPPAIATLQPPETLLSPFPKTFLLSRRFLPIKHVGEVLDLVVANPFDRQTIDEAKKRLGARSVRVRVGERTAITQRARELFGQTGASLLPGDTQSGAYLLLCMADDEAMTLAMRMADEGFRIEHTATAQGALEVLGARRPDAIICGTEYLGKGDALLLALRAEEETEELPFLLVGEADDLTVTRFFELGADDHFALPLSHDRLIAKLNRLLARRKRHTPKPMPLPASEDIQGLGDLPDLVPTAAPPMVPEPDLPDFAQPTGVMGTLKQMSVSEIVQSLELGRKTAHVELQPYDGHQGAIGFENGAVVFAECDGELGEKAFFKLAHHAEGFFRIRYGESPKERNIDKATTFLLLEAMRIIDEEDQ